MGSSSDMTSPFVASPLVATTRQKQMHIKNRATGFVGGVAVFCRKTAQGQMTRMGVLSAR
jgi:hypothetical protein